MVQLDETIYSKLLESQAKADKVPLLEAENQWLREQLGLAKHRLFASSSEATPPGQETMLFNEAEACAAPAACEPEIEEIHYTRRKPTRLREELFEGLPIEEIPYTLPEEEQVCPQCAGKLHKIGDDVRSEIKIIPAKFIHVRHLRAKYACRHCEHNEIHTPIVTAPMPETAFPGSPASPSAVAHIMCQKFVEGSPLYRQEQSFKREGIELSRQTMANWMLVGANCLRTIYDLMTAKLLACDILHADETRLQVLKEAGRAAQTTSFMWLYRSGRDGPPIVLYEYQTTRGGEHPRKFLKHFFGFLHVDGYVAYEGVPGVTLVGCWAHARRKFTEAIDVLPAADRKRTDTPAHIGLAYCNKLFAIERDLQDATPKERQAGREQRSKPLLEEFRRWLDDMSLKVLPKFVLGKAIGYNINQWTKLTAYMKDGRLEISNNRAERSIKPFVIGRLCGAPHNLPYVA